MLSFSCLQVISEKVGVINFGVRELVEEPPTRDVVLSMDLEEELEGNEIGSILHPPQLPQGVPADHEKRVAPQELVDPRPSSPAYISAVSRIHQANGLTKVPKLVQVHKFVNGHRARSRPLDDSLSTIKFMSNIISSLLLFFFGSL